MTTTYIYFFLMSKKDFFVELNGGGHHRICQDWKTRMAEAPPSPTLSTIQAQLYGEASDLAAALPLGLQQALVGSTIQGDGVLAAVKLFVFHLSFIRLSFILPILLCCAPRVSQRLPHPCTRRQCCGEPYIVPT